MESSQSPGRHPGIRKRSLTYILWIILAAAPILCGVLLYFATGTSILRLDAYNTSWGDEISYYRAVRLLRAEFFPRGVYGFGEEMPSYLVYGPHNFYTYLPYMIFSFVTGTGSHSFVYFCNVLMAVLAMLIFAVLVRPQVRESLWMIGFWATYLILGRCVWSGMGEGSFLFYLTTFIALVLWTVRNPGAEIARIKWAMFAMVLLTFLWNTMRPCYFPLLIIPIYLAWRKRSRLSMGARIVFTLLSAAAAIGSTALFFFLINENAAKNAPDSVHTDTLHALLGSGSPVTMTRQFLSVNRSALQATLGSLGEGSWSGIAALLFFAQVLMLLFLLLRTLAGGVPGSAADGVRVPGRAVTDGGAADDVRVPDHAVADGGAADDDVAAANVDGAFGGDELTAVADGSAIGGGEPAADVDGDDTPSARRRKKLLIDPDDVEETEEDLARFGVLVTKQSVNGASDPVYSENRPRDGRCLVLFAMLCTSITAFEVCVILYHPAQLHLLLLSILAVNSILFITLGGYEKIVNEALVVMLMAFLLLRAPQDLRLPQADPPAAAAEEKQAINTLSEVLPLSANPWDNTVCTLPREQAQKWMFLLPAHISLNVCREEYLTKALENGALRSRFVVLNASSALHDVCRQAGYAVVWEGYDQIMYQVR